MMPSVMQTLDSDKQLIITVTNKANSKNVTARRKSTIPFLSPARVRMSNRTSKSSIIKFQGDHLCTSYSYIPTKTKQVYKQ